MNLLFVCSRNQWRSPTAEKIYRTREGYRVRSAGTEPSARTRLTEKTIAWSDLIFVMEKKHKLRILEKYSALMDLPEIVILDIPDEYQFMDPELVEEITTKVDHYLKMKTE